MDNEELLRVCSDLAAVDPNEDIRFLRVVRSVLDLTGTPAADFAERLGISAPTVSKWLAGTALPHRRIRPSVVRCLSKILDGALETCRKPHS